MGQVFFGFKEVVGILGEILQNRCNRQFALSLKKAVFANILRQDMRTCEAGLRSTEKENSVVRPLVEEMTAKVASAVNHAIATGEFSPLEFHVADCLTPSLFWRATLWASERKAADPKNARARAREPPAT